MEQEILDKLEEEYTDDIIFDVEFVDFRIYKITMYITIERLNELRPLRIEFTYKYNVNFTFDYNMSIIMYNIDKKLKNMFRRDDYANNDND